MWTCLLCSKRVQCSWRAVVGAFGPSRVSDVVKLIKATVKLFMDCYGVPPHAEHILLSILKAGLTSACWSQGVT